MGIDRINDRCPVHYAKSFTIARTARPTRHNVDMPLHDICPQRRTAWCVAISHPRFRGKSVRLLASSLSRLQALQRDSMFALPVLKEANRCESGRANALMQPQNAGSLRSVTSLLSS